MTFVVRERIKTRKIEGCVVWVKSAPEGPGGTGHENLTLANLTQIFLNAMNIYNLIEFCEILIRQ